MRAVVLTEYGGPEVLSIGDVPTPPIGPEEVRVDVVATGLNRADLLQRMGLYPGPPMTHEIPGMEFSGLVSAVGERVDSVAAGDEVMGIVGGGAYAEQLVTHERLVMPVPASVPLADAAAVPEVFITAYDALVVQGGLRPGGTALVHAGASGVGTAAIQICRALGARVGVTASAGKLDACLGLGAQRAIDYATEDFVERMLDLTDGDGVDVVLDVIGGDYLARNVDVCRPGGRIIQVGIMGGASATISLADVLTKKIHLIGTTLRSRPIEEKIAISRRVSAEVLPWFDVGACQPVVDSRFAFDDVQDAHRYMQSNQNVGKILLDVMS